ncbi:MAG: hypothetical protein ACLP9L_08945 [Thermoguttaceae bacterium]
MFRLLYAFVAALDDRVERWLCGEEGWRSTFLLALVSQTVTTSILLGSLATVGGVVYFCRWANPDVRWIWCVLLAAILVPLAMIIHRWQSNLIEDDLERHEFDKTRFCPSCGRECSVRTPVCPRCETELR